MDYHTLAIDHSIWFTDTADKIRPKPDGPFYSDKPPVMALLMAAPYLALHDAFGFRAADHPDLFCYLMTLLSSGLAYVAAVWCVHRLGRVLGLSPGWAAALTASFALSTVAPVYSRNVNSHLPSLAAALGVLLNLAALGRPLGDKETRRQGDKETRRQGDKETRRQGESKAVVVSPPLLVSQSPCLLVCIGALAGFAYALEQPTGGLLLAAAAVAAAVRLRRPTAVVWIVLAALPWMVAHHAVTYACAGTFGPPNANPAFFSYNGSLFDESNLTGRWNHANLGDFAAYAFWMLFGEKGFVASNPTLLLALPAAWWAARSASRRPETLCFGLWCLGVWLLYAALSINYGGVCCTIRWFVPLLAPAYFWLALLLRDWPRWRLVFAALSGGGAVLAGFFWVGGPFGVFYTPYNPQFPLFLWSVLAASLLIAVACRAIAARGRARPR